MNDRERSVLQQIGRTARAMYAAFEADVGQPLPRWRVLHALHDGGELSQKDLAQRLSMDPASLTRQMKAMEAEGLVRRRSDPQDNRLTQVTLTKEGAALFAATQPAREAFAKRALKGLPVTDVAQAMALLRTLEARFRR